MARRMLAPINSVKHYVQLSNTAIASGAKQSQDVVHAVVAPATGTTADVKEGSIVKAIFFERWVLGDDVTGNSGQFTLAIEKLPGGGTPMTVTNLLNLGAYNNKKNILYTTQALIGSSIDGSPGIPMIRGWIKIPKGKQRMGKDDKIILHVNAVGKLRVCGFSTYKEYT